MPRMTAPLDAPSARSAISSASPSTYGATPTTPGCCAARPRTLRHSGNPAENAVSVACDVMLRIRVRSSRSNPFMTDSTTISTATPIATPVIDIIEMNDKNRLPVERR
jgi:hypothetical protein